jgi:hypothetical protein
MNHTLLTHLCGLALATGAAAQSATYTLFAEGCNGASATHCVALNDTNPVHQLASLPNEYAYPVVNTTGVAIQVTGFEVWTRSNSGLVETLKTGLIWDNAGPGAAVHTVPAPTNVANGTITATGTAGWCHTSIYPPITVPAGEAFWIHVDAYSRIAPPQHVTTGGVPGPASNYYRRPANGVPNWTASVSVARQIYRLHCLPETPTVPAMLPVGLPQIGQSFALELRGGQPFLPGFLIWSLDRTQFAGLPTPVDLALFGAPTCFAQTAGESVVLVLLDGSGVGSAGLVLPNDPSYLGLTWHNQAAVVAPGANAIDTLVTNAGTAVVGN